MYQKSFCSMAFLILSFETFQLLNVAWIAIGVITFFILLKINAPYGRHSSLAWGPTINNRIAWFVMEIPALLVTGGLVFWNNAHLSVVTALIGLLFCVHYVHRSVIFPMRLRTKGKKMPVLIMGSALLFNLINGFFIGTYLRNYAQYEVSWLTDPRFIIGVFLFISGMIINLISDSMLINLRKSNEYDYKIPRGFLFKKVSCPNHLGEILEWLGFAVLSWNLPALGFFIWTVANLLPRSVSHHLWYHQKFADYPQDRKAVIPFLL